MFLYTAANVLLRAYSSVDCTLAIPAGMYGGKGYLLRRASPRYRVKWHGFIVSIPTVEQYTGLEPVPSAWKAEMLAIEHQYCK